MTTASRSKFVEYIFFLLTNATPESSIQVRPDSATRPASIDTRNLTGENVTP